MERNGKHKEWLDPNKLILIQGWARDGLTDEQIAHNMGIAYSTLRVWRDKHQAISAALKKGKEVTDYAVESALYKSAINGNVTAMIFWLKNRKPEKWRDNRNGLENLVNEIEDLTPLSELLNNGDTDIND